MGAVMEPAPFDPASFGPILLGLAGVLTAIGALTKSLLTSRAERDKLAAERDQAKAEAAQAVAEVELARHAEAESHDTGMAERYSTLLQRLSELVELTSKQGTMVAELTIANLSLRSEVSGLRDEIRELKAQVLHDRDEKAELERRLSEVENVLERVEALSQGIPELAELLKALGRPPKSPRTVLREAGTKAA